MLRGMRVYRLTGLEKGFIEIIRIEVDLESVKSKVIYLPIFAYVTSFFSQDGIAKGINENELINVNELVDKYRTWTPLQSLGDSADILFCKWGIPFPVYVDIETGKMIVLESDYGEIRFTSTSVIRFIQSNAEGYHKNKVIEMVNNKDYYVNFNNFNSYTQANVMFGGRGCGVLADNEGLLEVPIVSSKGVLLDILLPEYSQWYLAISVLYLDLSEISEIPYQVALDLNNRLTSPSDVVTYFKIGSLTDCIYSLYFQKGDYVEVTAPSVDTVEFIRSLRNKGVHFVLPKGLYGILGAYDEVTYSSFLEPVILANENTSWKDVVTASLSNLKNYKEPIQRLSTVFIKAETPRRFILSSFIFQGAVSSTEHPEVYLAYNAKLDWIKTGDTEVNKLLSTLTLGDLVKRTRNLLKRLDNKSEDLTRYVEYRALDAIFERNNELLLDLVNKADSGA